jgi:hypothetical protein
MTRRNEDSGLIDLDALMRQAAPDDAAAQSETRPQEAPTSGPTPAPVASRTEVVKETRSSAAPVAASSVPAPASSARAADSSTAASSSTASARETAKAEPAPKSEPLPERTSYSKGDKLLIASVANDVTSDAPAAAAKKAAPKTKSVPPAPATMPSKLEPDSLDAVSTGPASAATSTATALAASRSEAPAAPRRRGALVALLAVAAMVGIFAFVRSRSSSNTGTVVAAATAPTNTATVERPSAPPPAEAPSASAEPTAEEPAPVASAAPSASAAKTAHHGGAVVAKKADPAAAATLTEGALEAQGPSTAGDLGDAMRGAVGAKDKAPAEAKETTSSGPNASQVRPSPGAVVGALGSVMPAARACLTPDDPARSGTIVFKSDGTVARVDIKGSKPEDDCVRDALSKAKVAPFVEETFSTRVTVRP